MAALFTASLNLQHSCIWLNSVERFNGTVTATVYSNHKTVNMADGGEP
jgi:hypothetical protein